jgi:molecular chaperone DnaK (HSP70)
MATYGIDLGTTNSCIAYVDDSGHPVVLKSAIGEDTTPSVVYFESPENVVVGRQAKDSALLAPDLVVELVKRQMGQDVHYSFHGQGHTPESVSALILREVTRAAAEQAGEEIHDVVITVPAYFGLLEKEATKKAGQIAGLRVLGVLAEPVAAALAYQSLGEATGVRHLLVYDLGGGTFDTTVIRIDGDDIKVICTDGNAQLGGADWDSKVIDYLLTGFTSQYPDLDPSGDEQFMQDLATSAEQLKKALSATVGRKHTVRFGGAAAQLELTREQFEELTSELLEQTVEITRRTIATAEEKGIGHFDDVLLVGGMTVMPGIARTLKERFGLDARQQDPHLAVAKGAAIFAFIQGVKESMTDEGDTAQVEAVAARLGKDPAEVTRIYRKKVETVAPRAFGIKVVDVDDPVFKTDPNAAREYIEHLLAANTQLPADTQPETFFTVQDYQRKVELQVWEQAGAVASEELQHNNFVGQGLLKDLPPRPAGAPFQVVFHMTDTGLLEVHAWEPKSGSEVRFEIQIGWLDEAQVRAATSQVTGYDVSG